jgi:hypothetical protein
LEKDHQRWLWQKWGEKCVQNLQQHDFDARFFGTIPEASRFVIDNLSQFNTFGFGGSDTTRRLGIVEELQSKGKTIYNHWIANLSREEDLDIRRRQGQSDCFICSANALSLTGEVVNVDGIGNRTSAMAFGPQKVVIIAGINKVTPDLHSAIRRVKEVSGPMRARSLEIDTPCAKSGVCTDCNSPQRICRITTILHRKPMLTDVTVVLINEVLGF